jgi:single-strand DNA-binding protein
MAFFNKVFLMGNLTRDPELRYTPKGTAVARLGLAINRVYTSETGEKKEEVTFVDVDAFARQAEVIGQYLKKGRRIFMEGRLRYEQWDDKQTGQKRSKLNVVLESFQFIDSLRTGEGAAPAFAPPAAAAAAAARPAPVAAPAPPVPEAPAPETEPLPSEDDVPF